MRVHELSCQFEKLLEEINIIFVYALYYCIGILRDGIIEDII